MLHKRITRKREKGLKCASEQRERDYWKHKGINKTNNKIKVGKGKDACILKDER